MRGIIFLWFGSVVSIPQGWALCDGAQGTPDLRTKFLIAAGTTYDPADVGGEPVHSHSFTGDGHVHAMPAGADLEDGGGFDKDSTNEQSGGTTGNTLGWPPYHALAYIMKLP